MDAHGGTDAVDSTVRVEDLSLSTLIALIARLRATETPAQFLCREVELDEAYLEADVALHLVEDEGIEPETFERAKLVRSLVLNAHDFLGESNLQAAVRELNKVIEIKIGLEGGDGAR